MKKTHYIISLIAVLSSHFVVSGQSDTFISYSHGINMNDYEKSIVNGDTIYTYIPRKWELRKDTIQEQESSPKSVYGVENWNLSHIPESYAVDHTKDIGEIAIHQGTASGALTCSVPIDAYFAANGMNPSVQLSYNSLSGNGIAGYGWHIGGLSAISACNSTVYYDNAPSPAKRDKTNAYMLDGMRLIDLKTGNSSLVNYETEQGNIKAVAYLNGNIIKYFKVYYPNGNTATYGYESNTAGKLAYPLTKMQDAVGNVINYTYTESGNMYYISEINYGGYEGTYSSNHYAKITFTYETRSDVSKIYSDGLEVISDKRLQWIRTYFNGQLLSSYNLIYENAQSSLLKKIECTNGGKSLNPLVFYYGENNQINSFYKGNVMLYSYFTNTSVPDLILTKGKFDLSSMNDGLIAYPYKNSYDVIKIKYFLGFIPIAYQYGSQYHPTQELLIYDKMGLTATPSKLTAETGFIQLLAMDVDGDGKDELVKINSTNVNASGETVKFQVYDTNNSYYGTGPELRYSFSTNYEGVVNWDDLLSPSAKTFVMGDFLGIGKQTFLSISYCKNIKDENVQSHATLIDFDTKGKSTLYDKPCFALEPGDRLYAIDFDGDWKTDICHISSSGAKIYTFNTNGQLYEIAAYPGLTLSSMDNRELLVGDVNGDGKTDFLLSPAKNSGNLWSLYLSTGASGGFVKKDINLTSYLTDMKFILQDMNNDGKTDLVVNNKGSISMYLASNGVLKSTPETQTTNVNADAHFIAGNIGSAYKMSQLFSIYDYTLTPITFSRDDAKQQLLTGAVTSTGIVSMHEYSDLRNPYGAYRRGDDSAYPYRNLMGNMYIHASTESYLANSFIASASYFYKRGMLDMRGRGFLGFEEIWMEDNFRGTTTTQIFDPKNFGILKSMSSPVASAVYNYNVNVAANKIAKITLANKTEQDKLKNISVTTTYLYDAYGNPTNETVNFGGGLKTVTDNQYNNYTSLSYYKLGELKSQFITNFRDTKQATVGKTIAYNAKGQTVNIKTTSNSYQIKEDVLSYDDIYSNLTEIKTKTYTSATYLSVKYQYDNNWCGRLTRKTDPLGLYETYGYNTRGLLQSVTDHKSNATQDEYDTWGRRSKTTYPDGTVESVNLKWIVDNSSFLSSPHNVGAGKYLYTLTFTGTGAPSKQSYIDAFGREIRAGQMQFDGNYLYTDKLYDYLGRIEKVSLPFKGIVPSRWNTYNYDDYDRVTSLDYASGKKDSYSYSGNSMTETVDGISRTTTYDAFGKMKNVTDPAGTITYQLRPDNQPEYIVAPGNMTTSFQYDQYGRQTGITDPSAGTQTYTYDAAGNVATEKNANNKAISYGYDTYNRLTQVTRPEFNTSYVYNADGLLASETSTNGTSTAFTYDAYGRKQKEKETVPDGKWLEKSFSYAGGNLSSTLYTSQNGNIVTENYTYSNGALSEIKLNNTTSIWKISTSNGLGQITSVTTGDFNRGYGYNIYGLPTGRTADTFLYHSYSFDALKGNLSYRKDNLKNIQENFTYDNLNRLTSFAGKSTGYDAKGNLLYRSDMGTFQYNISGKPYAISGVTSPTNAIPLRAQTLSHTSFKRPSSISEGEYTAAFTYNGKKERVKMELKKNGAKELNRYYVSDCYEIDDMAVGGIKEKLYLGGDFYSAPAVYVKESSGNWNIYYICRDYLGSITHITNSSGSVVQELSYDAWGRLRNPANLMEYAQGSEPVLFLGRGYTGHEHLIQFGLINMNARLYSPVLGRFLSPDPYIQDPFFSQNFNRYSYCFNNPLIYTDPDGEIIWWLAAAAVYYLFFTDAGYQLQKYISPIAFQIDFKWGTHQKGLGFNVGVGVPKLFPIAPWKEFGATYYWKNWGDYQGWETRHGKETTYWGIWTEGETKYKSGEFSQTVGYKKLGIPGNVGVDVYNDLWGDGGDRFRTSRVRVNLFPGIYLENVLFTGDPGMDERHATTIEKCGSKKTYIKNPKDPYAPDPNKYRHGVLSIGIGPISIGYDSENIRYFIQNMIVHNLTDSNYFRYVREKKGKWYFQFGCW